MMALINCVPLLQKGGSNFSACRTLKAYVGDGNWDKLIEHHYLVHSLSSLEKFTDRDFQWGKVLEEARLCWDSLWHDTQLSTRRSAAVPLLPWPSMHSSHNSSQIPCMQRLANLEQRIHGQVNRLLSRTDRNPYPRRTLLSLQKKLANPMSASFLGFQIPSSFSAGASSAATPLAAAAPPAAGAPPPPEPPDGTEANLLEPSAINCPYN